MRKGKLKLLEQRSPKAWYYALALVSAKYEAPSSLFVPIAMLRREIIEKGRIGLKLLMFVCLAS